MTRGENHGEQYSDEEAGTTPKQPNENGAVRSELNQPMRKMREVPPPARAMVRTRMPDAPGGMGISIRPLPREACAPRIPPDTEDTWDQVEPQQEESPETSSDER